MPVLENIAQPLEVEIGNRNLRALPEYLGEHVVLSFVIGLITL